MEDVLVISTGSGLIMLESSHSITQILVVNYQGRVNRERGVAHPFLTVPDIFLALPFVVEGS